MIRVRAEVGKNLRSAMGVEKRENYFIEALFSTREM